MKEFLLRRITHADNRIQKIKEIHGKNASNTHNYFGGQTLGYWQGMLTAYETMLDEIESTEEENA